jgi:hypothetical protein
MLTRGFVVTQTNTDMTQREPLGSFAVDSQNLDYAFRSSM